MAEASLNRILLADDEESMRTLVRHILEDMGYEVDLANDGRRALEMIAARRPDLLILDLMMPEMDGWGVLERLRESEDPPPVLLLTARSDYATFVRAVRGGVTAFIGKPFRLQELVNACKKILFAVQNAGEDIEAERRRKPRRRLLVEVKVYSKDHSPMALGEVVNLSPGGAQLDLDAPLPPGDRIRIAFHTSGGQSPLNLDCEVLWWRSAAAGRVAHGLAFRNLTPDDDRHLAELFAPPV